MADDLLATLREESESEHVTYTEFALAFKKDSKLLYCFFEGKEDKRYYGIRISQITRREFDDFTCRGKQRMQKLHSMILQRKEYSEASLLYFLDGDYNNKHTYEHFYMLPCYSIENLYATVRAFKVILKNEFELRPQDPDFILAVKLYEKLQNEFHDKTAVLNSWLACQTDADNPGLRLNIDDRLGKYFQGLVKDDLSSVSNLSDLQLLDTIAQLFPGAKKPLKADLQKKLRLFKSKGRQRTFRGKFELSFLISFLTKLQKDTNSKRPKQFMKSHKCNLRFETRTAISALSQYAETPKCLIEYLEKWRED